MRALRCILVSLGVGLLATATSASGAVLKTNAADLGQVARDAEIDLTVALQLRNADQAALLMQSIYRPGSPQFRSFMTPAQFYEKFGPVASTIAKVTQHFKAAGFHVMRLTGTQLRITGSARSVESEFGIRLHAFEFPLAVMGRVGAFRSPVGTPQISSAIAVDVAAVVGFDTQPTYRPHLIRSPALLAKNAVKPARPYSSGTTNTPGELLVTDFEQYYDVDPLYAAGLTGRGKTIGIVTFASFTPHDAFTYWKAVGLDVSSKRIEEVKVDGGSGVPSDASGSDETTLDVEQSGGISPGSIIKVYEAPNTTQGFIDNFAKAVDANIADTISCSWGGWEFFDTLTKNPDGSGPVRDPTSGRHVSVLKALNDVLLQGALQGQSMYVASGDSGAYDETETYSPPSYPPPHDSEVLSVDDPAAQQWATAVGGTTLPGPQVYPITATQNLTIDIPTEQAWGWDYLVPLCKAQKMDPVTCGIYPVGSGGGVSSYVPRPFYQEGITGIQDTKPGQALFDYSQEPPAFVVTLPGGYAGRNVPDISLNADPQTGYLIYYTSDTSGFVVEPGGGTSFAAPQMNGVTAIFDEALGGRVGLLNSALYDLLRDGHAYGGAKAPLRDITKGDNWFYHGLPGYDRTTGAGVPDFAKLLEALEERSDQMHYQ